MSLHQTVSNAPKPGLRGDYSGMRPDYTVEQDWAAYSVEEHALYRQLYLRQMRLLPGYACEEFLSGLAFLGSPDGIPRFETVSKKLMRATRWELVGVPGLIPDLTFFEHLANRRFPVTTWLRKPEEFDYIVEPDVFHDLYGHVPLLFDPTYADYVQAYGKGGLKAAHLDSLTFLARLYWYTVEFGLVASPNGLRVYGAGILSSGGEVVHSIESPAPHRIRFDLERVMRTDYHIDRFQDTYFVIDSFEQLMRDTAPDFTPIYERLRSQPPYAADTVLPTDQVFPADPGRVRFAHN